MISNNHFKNVFDDLIDNGFQVQDPLTWSFFFFSEKKSNLQHVINELEGYDYVTIITKFNKEYKLVANKIDILTPEKLEKRNIAFAELADYCDVLYDGWEVSK